MDPRICVVMDTPPLYSDCPDCRDNPAFVTRQRALMKRPALAWHQACAKHAPGSNRFHETMKILASIHARRDARVEIIEKQYALSRPDRFEPL